MFAFLKYQKLTLLWALFVFIMCNISLGEVGHDPMFFPGFDKLTHCGFFFVFTVLAANGIISRYKRISYSKAFGLLVLSVAFGGAIELLQLYIFTWRSGEWNDLFADTVGICMALFCILVTQYALQNEKN
jgi:VanZ family protein